MQVMRPERRRRLAKPMHHIRPIGVVAVVESCKGGDSRTGDLEIFNGGHDVDDRFCRQSRHGRASDMFDWPRKPTTYHGFQSRALPLKKNGP